MAVRFAFVLLLAAPLPLGLWAQTDRPAPPAGNDSIYALRVDPAAHPGLDYVLLLEDGVARLEADGRSTYTLRQVAQVLTADGAEYWGEFTFQYVPERQRLRINWMRVIGPDGTVLRDGPEHQQETSPTVDQGAPVYSDRRAVQATLGAVTAGTLVDYSYTVETFRPHLPRDWRYYWAVNGDTPVRRSRFTLDVPADFDLPVRERNLDFAARERAAGGRRVRSWAAADVPAVRWESYAGSPNTVLMAIVVGGPLTWDAIGDWYRGQLTDRFALTPEILAAHAAQVARAGTLDDSLRATYRWVAQDFRYVSLSLGDGGYQPRTPAEVFRTRFGDCKDKTVLFVALARRMGVTAYPVLVNSEGPVDSLLPSLRPFDHMIAAVVRRDGRTEYADATVSLLPYGELPVALQQEVGLAIPDGERGARVVVLPATPPAHNRYDREVVGRLDLEGRFIGRVTLSARGTEQFDLREAFADVDRQDARVREQRLREYAQAIYETAVVDSAHYVDGRDLAATPSVTVWFTAPRVIGRIGARYYFNLPLIRFADAGSVSRLEAEGERRFPIDVAQVNSPSVWRSSIEVELPEGWKADVPAAVAVDGPFGYYRASYAQAGRTFRASREMGGGRGLEPPDSVAALRAWFRSVAADGTAMIVVERGSGSPLAAGAAEPPGEGAIGELPAIVLGRDDLPAGVQVATEGPGDADDGFQSIAAADPIESYQRSFAAEQMVFTVGSSRLVMLQAVAAAYHNPTEAQRPLGLLNLMDLPAVFGLYLETATDGQASFGAARPIDVGGIGDQSAGWTFEFVTPLATFEMALLVAARHRVALTLVAMGPQGLAGADLAGLLRAMDRRAQAHQGYGAEVAIEAGADTATAADSALRASTAVALDAMVVVPPELAPVTTSSALFGLNNGWPQYSRTVEGRGLTFPFRRQGAVTLVMDAMLHETEAQALKRVLFAESGDREYLFGSVLSDTGKIVERNARHDSSTITRVALPPLGARSFAMTGKIRAVMRLDVDAVFFAAGRLSGLVRVWRLADGGEPGAAAALARDIRQRMRRLAPEAGDAAPPARLVREIQRVVAAERAVDSLVDARAFDAAFATIERAALARAPVSFWTRTWNKVCWWASLHGHAARARAACDAAVTPDTTIVPHRDSRGLARALTGDLAGAAADFAYGVEHGEEGAVREKRTAWLEALRAGTNPFTEQVLTELRRP